MNVRSYITPAADAREVGERVRSHMPLARKIAWQIHGRVNDLFDIEDLIQIGMTALVEAAQRFKDTGEATFGTYASMRIRGALIDHLRGHLNLTRTAVQRRDRIKAAEAAVAADGGDNKDQDLVAAKLGITASELQSWRSQIIPITDKSLDEVYDDHASWFADNGPTPESAMMDDQMRVRLATLLKRLGEREALVLQLYYIEEMNLDEISEVLSVTVGRVSQLKKSALAQLRSWLTQD